MQTRRSPDYDEFWGLQQRRPPELTLNPINQPHTLSSPPSPNHKQKIPETTLHALSNDSQNWENKTKFLSSQKLSIPIHLRPTLWQSLQLTQKRKTTLSPPLRKPQKIQTPISHHAIDTNNSTLSPMVLMPHGLSQFIHQTIRTFQSLGTLNKSKTPTQQQITPDKITKPKTYYSPAYDNCKNPNPSILGPHPHSYNYTPRTTNPKTPSPLCKAQTPPSNKHLLPPYKLLSLSRSLIMDPSDEELIKKFAGLQASGASSSTALIIPNEAAVSTNWDLCVVVKVCTDRMIFDGQFENIMRRAWNARPTTIFRQIGRGSYRIEFSEKEEVDRVLNDGPWTYRQDLVAVASCKSEEQAREPILRLELWVQFHNAYEDSLKDEGLCIIAAQVGIPVSDPIRCNYNGKNFFKIRLSIPITERMKDKIRVTHPNQGEIWVYLVLEKLGRICTFCAMLGYELNSCADRLRLTRLKNSSVGQERPDMKNILSPSFGP